MSAYTQITYHLVFSTKHRQKVLNKSIRNELFRYITGILGNQKCHVYQVNGIEDHIHIAFYLHPSIALSTLVKDIKLATSVFIKSNQLVDNFPGWQEGYGAFTCSIRQRPVLIEYIKNQEIHHHQRTFHDEYIKILKENGIEWTG